MKFLTALLKILLIGIGLILVGGVIFFKTVDVNRYRPSVERGLGEMIGREVDIGDIQWEFSWKRGVVLVFRQVFVTDNPDFSHLPFFTAERIAGALDVRALVLDKEVVISHLSVRKPHARLIRDVEGRWNVATFQWRPPSGFRLFPNKGGWFDVRQAEADQGQGPWPVTLRVVDLRDGGVNVINQGREGTRNITIRRMEMRLKDLGLGKAFSLGLKAGVLSRTQNVHLEAKGRLLNGPSGWRVEMASAQARTDLKDVDLSLLSKEVWGKEKKGPLEALAGQVTIKVQEAVWSRRGLERLRSKGNLSYGRVALKGVLPIEHVSASLTLTESDATISEVFMNVGSGRLRGYVGIKDYGSDRSWRFSLEVEDMALEQIVSLVPTEALPVGLRDAEVRGRLEGSLKGDGRGWTKDWMRDAEADGKIMIKDAKIVNKNLFQWLLSEKVLGGHVPAYILRQVIEERLPKAYQGTLEQPRTVFDDLTVPVQLRQGRVSIGPARVSSSEWACDFSARFERGTDDAIQLGCVLAPEISRALVEDVDIFRSLLDKDDRVRIPFKPYRGPWNRYRPQPDIRFIRDFGRDQLKKVLRKALGVEEEDQERVTTDGKDQVPADRVEDTPKQKEIQSTGELIDTIFDAIF